MLGIFTHRYYNSAGLPQDSAMGENNLQPIPERGMESEVESASEEKEQGP